MRFDGVRDSLPDLDKRRNLRNSAFCFRSSFSSVLFMARRDEFDISRSRTFRSLRALAAASICSFVIGWSAVVSDEPRMWRGCICGRLGGPSGSAWELVIERSPARAELMLVDLGVDGDKEEVTAPVEVGSVTTARECIWGFEARLTSETEVVLRLVNAAELVLKDFL